MTAEHSPKDDAMLASGTDASPRRSALTLDEIEKLIQQAQGAAESALEPKAFYSLLLDLTIRATGSLGGALWLRETNGQFSLQHEIGLSQLSLFQSAPEQLAHSRLLQTALESESVYTATPRSGELSGAAAPNPSNLLLLIGTHQEEHSKPVLIEIFQAAETASAVRRGAEQVLAAMCAAVGGFQQRRRLVEAGHEASQRDAEIRFAKAVHRPLLLAPTAYTIANDGREFLECDRLSVVRLQGRTRVLAVSGVDSPDQRANSVRSLERLAEVVAALGENVDYDGSNAEHLLPPQVEHALQAHVDQHHVRRLQVELLRDESSKEEADSSAPLGVLIAESFTGESPSDTTRRLRAVAEHAAIAIAKAAQYESRWWSWLQQGSIGTKVAIAVALIALIVIGMIPVEFAVSARGELQPKVRREVFAPMDAEIVEVFVEHNDPVASNAPLASLRSADMERELQKVMGEQDTTRKRIDALQSLRIGGGGGAEDQTLTTRRFAAEILELEARLASIEKQLATLRTQKAQLQLQSPISGDVVTWDVQQLLAGRPVRRGQVLMTVVQPEGDWQAELRVPDQSIRHVLRAAARLKTSSPTIRYILASDTNTTRRGVIKEIGASVSMDRREEPFIRVLADIDPDNLNGAQPGATVVARIACGHRPLAYVLTHQVIEAVQTWLFF